jgi:hypothetical protein
MGKIITDAEAGLSSSANYGFIRCVPCRPLSSHHGLFDWGQATELGQSLDPCDPIKPTVLLSPPPTLNSSSNFTPKPMSMLESQASNVAKTIIDMAGSVAVVVTNRTEPVRLVAKYKPGGGLLGFVQGFALRVCGGGNL